MNKTKIDWCDMSWNPVVGCLHNCGYCYAEKITKRFGGQLLDGNLDKLHILEREQRSSIDGRILSFPYGFEPTFYRYRLDEPQRIKKPQKIFVVDMGDLFGDWVPDTWIEQVFKACEAAPWHKYLFLTKNPAGLKYPFHLNFANKNFWIGTSITNTSDSVRMKVLIDETTRNTNRFISVEPLLGNMGPMLEELKDIKWVIIGQQTGPGAKFPQGEWVQSIIDQCKASNVPVLIKRPLYEKFPIQQWPEGLEV